MKSAAKILRYNLPVWMSQNHSPDDWNRDHMRKLYRLPDYCQSNHVTVVLGKWDTPSSKEDRPDIATDKLQKYHMDENDPRCGASLATISSIFATTSITLVFAIPISHWRKKRVHLDTVLRFRLRRRSRV